MVNLKYPLIDKRSFEDLVNEAKEKAPYFVPEWKMSTNNPDIGTALFMVVALQLKENIDLLNKSVNNNLKSFLNYLNVNLKPPKPSKVPVVFNLSEGYKNSVLIKSNTGLLGKGLNDETIRFETDSMVEIVPCKIKNIFATSSNDDIIAKFSGDEQNLVCFGENNENIQEHNIYMSNESILTCSLPMEFEIIFNYNSNITAPELKCLANGEYIKWMYSTENGFKEFDNVTLEGKSLKLIKNNDDLISEATFNQAKWIKCVINNNCIKYFENLFIDGVYLKAKLLEDKSQQKKIILCNNTTTLDNDEFTPFNIFYNQYDSFYIGLDEVFSKKGSNIEIDFNMEFLEASLSNEEKEINWKPIMKESDLNSKKPPVISIHTVKWQYFDGIVWRNIDIDKKYERIFYRLNKDKTITVNFKCPEDIAKAEVNGHTAYFIRLTVDMVENAFQVHGVYMSPKITNFKLKFNYRDNPAEVEKIITYNNGEFKDEYNFLGAPGITFKPFKPLEYEGNAIYICLDYPIDSSSLNLLFLIEKINNKFIYDKKVQIEYLVKERNSVFWKPKKIDDETRGLTQNGIITLVDLTNLKEEDYFGKRGYWIRLLFDKEDCIPRHIKAIYINGVWASQATTIEKEFLEFEEEKHNSYLSKKPIVEVELWVNELSSLGQSETHQILNNKLYEYKDVYDDMGILKELWVKWHMEEHFYNADSQDRVFKVDFLTGMIEFGDGVNGKRLPTRQSKNVYVNYKVSHGELGNIGENCINQIEESIAFIDSVYNPEKALGGVNIESIDNAMKRATNKIRHRNRGVASKDLEDIVKEVSNDIHEVKCITNVNNFMEQENGSLNLVVALKDNILEGMSYNLKNDIENYLISRVPSNVKVNKNLYICDPEIVEIEMNVNITIDDKANKGLVNERLKFIIDQYLDYKTGNHDNKGWSIGELPREDDFYNIILDDESVININNIAINLYEVNKIEKKEISYKDASKKKNIIIISGKHKIQMNTVV